MIDRSATATDAAKRIWGRTTEGAAAPGDVAAAAGHTLAQLEAGLSRWIGAEGYRALMRRALDEERPAHSALAELHCDGADGPAIEAAVRALGVPRVRDGLVALLGSLIELLGRVIGEEMATQLVEQAGAVHTGQPGSNEEQAP